MSIHSDAEKDLALGAEDAENVAGGREVAKKKVSTVKHRPAVTSYAIRGAPLSGDAGDAPGLSEAELDSDPDC
jgi:hypothetical protein